MDEPSIAVPPVPPPADPLLTLARVSFHTNDDDKDNDTLVQVSENLPKRFQAATLQCGAHWKSSSTIGYRSAAAVAFSPSCRACR